MWRVTEDVFEGKEVNVESRDMDDAVAAQKKLKKSAFQMFDDDGNLCYKGFFYGDCESEDGFRPLDDYGAPNVGCTYIQYKNTEGRWETL